MQQIKKLDIATRDRVVLSTMTTYKQKRGEYLHVQSNARAFSPWRQIGPRTNLICCDCGLTHTFRFAMREGKKSGTRQGIKLYWSLRRHEAMTKQQRRKSPR